MEKTDKKAIEERFKDQIHEQVIHARVDQGAIVLKGIYMVLIRIADALERAHRDRSLNDE